MTDSWHSLLAAVAGAGVAGCCSPSVPGRLKVLVALWLPVTEGWSSLCIPYKTVLRILWSVQQHQSLPLSALCLGKPRQGSWYRDSCHRFGGASSWEEVSCWASRGERLCAGSDSRTCLQGGCMENPDGQRHSQT